MRLEPADLESLRPLLSEIVRDAVAGLATKQPATNDEPRVYTESQAAELLQLQKHNLREARKAGKIAFTRTVGRRIAYTKQDIDDFLKRERVEASN